MEDKNSARLHKILLDNFNIHPAHFSWELPLNDLHPNFKILSYLVFLEQLLQKELDMNIPLIENINTAFHTPKDVLNLINNEL